MNFFAKSNLLSYHTTIFLLFANYIRNAEHLTSDFPHLILKHAIDYVNIYLSTNIDACYRDVLDNSIEINILKEFINDYEKLRKYILSKEDLSVFGYITIKKFICKTFRDNYTKLSLDIIPIYDFNRFIDKYNNFCMGSSYDLKVFRLVNILKIYTHMCYILNIIFRESGRNLKRIIIINDLY